MRKISKLSDAEIRALYRLSAKLELLHSHFVSSDVKLNRGPVTISQMLNGAVESLDVILDELYDLSF